MASVETACQLDVVLNREWELRDNRDCHTNILKDRLECAS